jgi:DNA repair exonuclease SbcCD ATPase subunit
VATSSADTAARLEALAKEREVLREEVAQVRKSLEEIQEKHDEELSSMREQLANAQGEKEQAESQYRSLLGKVNTIKSQLGERLKADAVRVHVTPPFCPANVRVGRFVAGTESDRGA